MVGFSVLILEAFDNFLHDEFRMIVKFQGLQAETKTIVAAKPYNVLSL